MRVLIACEFSGTVRDAFRRAGHQAWSCDTEPSEGEFRQFHFQCDVREVLGFGWDLMIAHPPCKYLANSGAKHLYLPKMVDVRMKTGEIRQQMQRRKDHGEDPERWEGMRDGAAFFNMLMDADIPRICVENPVQHSHARKLTKKWSQTVQPWQFSHPEVKRTCFWLKNLPKLVPTGIVDGRKAVCHSMGPSPTRSADRARTYAGVAQAFVDQWGALI